MKTIVTSENISSQLQGRLAAHHCRSQPLICNASTMLRKQKSDADNKKIILFVLEIWREAVFKLTDCPRNVGDSATPSDKEDLISMFVQKNATSISLPISAR